MVVVAAAVVLVVLTQWAWRCLHYNGTVSSQLVLSAFIYAATLNCALWCLCFFCLSFVQIVEQVVSAKRYLESVGDPAPVSGVVFMGMGEPFDNYER